jgi:hypothetical protein
MLSKSEISRRICISEAKRACSIYEIEVLENPYLLRGISKNFKMMKCCPNKNCFWTRVIFYFYEKQKGEYGNGKERSDRGRESEKDQDLWQVQMP